jgi:hypothetical protein
MFNVEYAKSKIKHHKNSIKRLKSEIDQCKPSQNYKRGGVEHAIKGIRLQIKRLGCQVLAYNIKEGKINYRFSLIDKVESKFGVNALALEFDTLTYKLINVV